MSSTAEDPPLKTNKGQKQLSHSLSWALRHKAVELGFHMTSDGYVPVDEILNSNHTRFRNYTVTDVREVVESSDKQRYKLAERPASNYGRDSEGTILCIRANQGHSMAQVDPDLLLDRLDAEELASLPMIVHGTYAEAWNSIQNQGLKRQTRNHIHFATGLPEDDGVISGMRKSCEINIYVDAKKCAADGIVFYRSENNVLLTAGVNDEGTLPAKYFSRVTDASGVILMNKLD